MSDRVLAVSFWLALAFATYSAFAPPNLVAAPRVGDVALHAFAFFVLTTLLQMAYFSRQPLRTALCMLGYGLFIEVVQLWLPDRSAELKDLMVDVLGIAAGLLAYRLAGQPATRLLRSWVD